MVKNNIDIEKISRVHFTGIKGVGMTALALALRDMGKIITGDDTEEIFVTDEVLKKENIQWGVGFTDGFLKFKPDLLITTAAHGGLNNPQVLAAKKAEVPVLTYAEALAKLAGLKKLITVCGVGGKTTISSMLSVVLEYAGMEPSFVVGVGNIYPLNTPGKYNTNGKYFVCEADEYAISPGVNNNPKFSLFSPDIVVVTNIEYDHPDIYKSISDNKKAYRDFLLKIPKSGLVIANYDNKNTIQIVRGIKAKVITYGENSNADYQLKNFRTPPNKTEYSIYSKKDKVYLANIGLNTPGIFNALNALAAFVVCRTLGMDIAKIKNALESYLGCRRRVQYMGNHYDADFYDDYAHHPNEVEKVIVALKGWYPDKKLITIFQPHTYSRTKALMNDFSKAFKDSDIVIFMDIYSSARENPDPTVSSKILAGKAKQYCRNSIYLSTQKKVLGWIKKNVNDKCVVLTLGAGDIFHIYNEIG